jgi:CO dehydrogenase maturation factor
VKIAVSGKGGVGKTLIAGALACNFAGRGFKTIAIDADPSPNLSLTLGVLPENTRGIVPISENKKLVESKTDTGVSGVYRLSFTVDDIVRDFSFTTPCDANLIVMGTVRSMGAGCTCAANAVVRALLRHLVVERDEVILVDMEAGVEHLGRGTARHVDLMLIITDSSIKSLEIAKHIHELATDAGIKQVLLVGNKVANNDQKDAIARFAEENRLKVLDVIPFDDKVVKAEMQGKTPLNDHDSVAVQTIEKLSERLLATLH